MGMLLDARVLRAHVWGLDGGEVKWANGSAVAVGPNNGRHVHMGISLRSRHFSRTEWLLPPFADLIPSNEGPIHNVTREQTILRTFAASARMIRAWEWRCFAVQGQYCSHFGTDVVRSVTGNTGSLL